MYSIRFAVMAVGAQGDKLKNRKRHQFIKKGVICLYCKYSHCHRCKIKIQRTLIYLEYIFSYLIVFPFPFPLCICVFLHSLSPNFFIAFSFLFSLYTFFPCSSLFKISVFDSTIFSLSLSLSLSPSFSLSLCRMRMVNSITSIMSSIR